MIAYNFTVNWAGKDHPCYTSSQPPRPILVACGRGRPVMLTFQPGEIRKLGTLGSINTAFVLPVGLSSRSWHHFCERVAFVVIVAVRMVSAGKRKAETEGIHNAISPAATLVAAARAARTIVSFMFE